MFEWMMDPAAWAGLMALIVIEIVLGIDNLIFIAILADKLPPEQRDRARQIGLALALVMRLGLLSSIAWLVTLTEPLITIWDKSFSGRDLILLGGGLFLLFKATRELDERLEGATFHGGTTGAVKATFGMVVMQIIALDAVFSIDSMITAVGMTNNLMIMMIAVIVSVILMIIASKPLGKFVSEHPTIIMLCLGFLLMIGLCLVAEGFGAHIPKGYLYGAIGFAIAIEFLNQLARFNRRRAIEKRRSLRERTADTVLRLLGAKTEGEVLGDELVAMVGTDREGPAFDVAEQGMIRGVLSLAERRVRSIMTPRLEVDTISADDDIETIKKIIQESPYSRLVAVSGSDDAVMGIVQKKDLLSLLLSDKAFKPLEVMQEALVVPGTKTALKMLEEFKQKACQMALIVDEFGSFEGLVTLTDVLETIAGDIREEHESAEPPNIQPQEDGSFLVDGRADIEDLCYAVGVEIPRSADFHTVAGLVLNKLENLPSVGDKVIFGEWLLTVTKMDSMRISQITVVRDKK